MTPCKQLLQHPVVVTPTKAIIGRPKERVRELPAVNRRGVADRRIAS